jgi:6-hydroxytryprostatin B O-methyltransferase
MATFNEIAATVTETAAEVSRLLKELQLPEPSFNEDSASSFDPRQHAAVNNEQLRQARNALINATQDLNRLTMGPIDHITSMAWYVTALPGQCFIGD